MNISKQAVLEIIEKSEIPNDWGHKSDLLNAINALPSISDGWISVAEYMPENKRYVLVYVSERQMSFMAYREDGYWMGEFYEVINYNTATHWRVLPPAPTK